MRNRPRRSFLYAVIALLDAASRGLFVGCQEYPDGVRDPVQPPQVFQGSITCSFYDRCVLECLPAERTVKSQSLQRRLTRTVVADNESSRNLSSVGRSGKSATNRATKAVPSVSWSTGGVLISEANPRYRILKDSSLKIQPVSMDEAAATFECRNLTDNKSIARWKISVTDTADIVEHPDTQITDPGRTVRFYCNATGYPPPKIIWQKNGETLTSEHRIVQLDHRLKAENPSSTDIVGSELIINAVMTDDAGIYSCFVHQEELGFDVLSRTAELRIARQYGPSPPTGLQVFNVETTSAQLKWQKAGVASLYVVHVYELGGSKRFRNYPTSKTFYELVDLFPNTTYRVEVQGVGRGLGARLSNITFTTKDDGYGSMADSNVPALPQPDYPAENEESDEKTTVSQTPPPVTHIAPAASLNSETSTGFDANTVFLIVTPCVAGVVGIALLILAIFLRRLHKKKNGTNGKTSQTVTVAKVTVAEGNETEMRPLNPSAPDISQMPGVVAENVETPYTVLSEG